MKMHDLIQNNINDMLSCRRDGLSCDMGGFANENTYCAAGATARQQYGVVTNDEVNQLAIRDKLRLAFLAALAFNVFDDTVDSVRRQFAFVSAQGTIETLVTLASAMGIDEVSDEEIKILKKYQGAWAGNTYPNKLGVVQSLVQELQEANGQTRETIEIPEKEIEVAVTNTALIERGF